MNRRMRMAVEIGVDADGEDLPVWFNRILRTRDVRKRRFKGARVDPRGRPFFRQRQMLGELRPD